MLLVWLSAGLCLPAADSDQQHSCSCDILKIFLEETSGDNNWNLKKTGIPDFFTDFWPIYSLGVWSQWYLLKFRVSLQILAENCTVYERTRLFRQIDNLLYSDCDSIQSEVFKHGTCFSISLLCSERLESLVVCDPHSFSVWCLV